jgi:hypothetical protein
MPSTGVLTCDPRIVRDARVVGKLTFDEATELSYFGAQVRLWMEYAQPLRDGVPLKNDWELHICGIKLQYRICLFMPAQPA